MRSVKETLIQLNPLHAKAIRQELAKDEGYNQYTLFIFDAFLNHKEAHSIQEELKINEKSFKLFERSIGKAIFEYYNIEDKTVQDLIFSSIFYSLYGSSHKNEQSRTEELEQLFHTMKQFNIEEASAPLLQALKEVNIGSPLEAVYTHLFNKYSTISAEIDEMIAHFSRMNGILGIYEKESENKTLLKKQLISAYKSIRAIAENHQNNTSAVILNLAKLVCVVFAKQDQLLKDGNTNLGTLITSTNLLIDKLPFGIDRFYFRNVYHHIYARHLANVDKQEIAKVLLNKVDHKALFEAQNFNFPNELSQTYINRETLTKPAEPHVIIPFNQTQSNTNFQYFRGDLFSNILN